MVQFRLLNRGILTLWVLLVAVCPAGHAATPTFAPNAANEVAFPAREARFVQLVIFGTSGGQPCLDELEVYGEGGKNNLALAQTGARATASSCLAGHAIHRVEHLNDGKYGN
jgi:hypothetical protein